MPSELRHILFRPAEVAMAIKEYHRRTGTPLPPGGIVRCGPESEGTGSPMRFRLVLAPDLVENGAPGGASAPAQREIVVEGSVLAAALILYCRDRRIPIPVTGDKSLQRFGDQVGLIVTMNLKQSDLLGAERLG